MKIDFPVLGLHRGLASEAQPQATSFDLLNVKPEDTTSDRLRGGQRGGLVKAYSTQIPTQTPPNYHPVLQICSVVTTYIEPV